MKKSNMKSLIIWRTACILLFFTLITTHFSAALPARYTSTASGSDSARVAKFAGGTIEMMQTEAEKKHSLDGLTLTANVSYFAYVGKFKITFDESEVAREYTLVLSFVPQKTITVNGSTPHTTFIAPTTFTAISSDINGYNIPQGYSAYKQGSGSWSNIENQSNDGSLTLEKLSIPMEGASYEFSVVYFVPAAIVNNARTAESSIMLCEVICEQVD